MNIECFGRQAETGAAAGMFFAVATLDRPAHATIGGLQCTITTVWYDQAPGYIIQNGITLLNNDGYWFAAAYLRNHQNELLNGVRWADAYDGRQTVDVEVCELFGLNCNSVPLTGITDWPAGADNHYYNPR